MRTQFTQIFGRLVTPIPTTVVESWSGKLSHTSQTGLFTPLCVCCKFVRRFNLLERTVHLQRINKQTAKVIRVRHAQTQAYRQLNTAFT